MSCANNKGADQPAHLRSLISAFVVRCLDSVMSLDSVTKIPSTMLASVAEQASMSLTWLETPEDTFSHDEAHMEMGRNPDISFSGRIVRIIAVAITFNPRKSTNKNLSATNINEPPRDKTNKMVCAPSEASDQPRLI